MRLFGRKANRALGDDHSTPSENWAKPTKFYLLVLTACWYWLAWICGTYPACIGPRFPNGLNLSFQVRETIMNLWRFNKKCHITTWQFTINVTHLLHENNGRKRRVESSDVGARIRRRGRIEGVAANAVAAGCKERKKMSANQWKIICFIHWVIFFSVCTFCLFKGWGKAVWLAIFPLGVVISIFLSRKKPSN